MIALLTALDEEARPLLARLGLRRHPARGLFALYRGEFADRPAWLVVSGVGKVRAAAAVAYAHTVADTRGATCAWLNAGVAGHAELARGTPRLAHTIEEHATGRRWYPSLALLGAAPASALVSVETPEHDYPTTSLYDMEAAGFYPIAVRTASAELVQCIKIVSDNRKRPASQLTGAGIEELIDCNAEAILDCAARLSRAAAALPDPALIDPAVARLLGTARFSATQRLRLARLVQRWRVLAPGREPLDEPPRRDVGARELLRALEARLQALPVRLPAP